jgi:hypothetical protein
MPHFILLRDREGVVGVWSTEDGVTATRWGLELSLTYPGCGVVIRRAASLSAFAATEPSLDFSGHDAEPLDVRRRPKSDRPVADAPLMAVG